MRWEDSAVIGYQSLQLPDGSYGIDVENPYFGDSETKLDAWVGYTRKIMDGKIDWKIQLNVRNLLDDDDLIPVGANPNGGIHAYRIQNGLTWQLRSNFSF